MKGKSCTDTQRQVVWSSGENFTAVKEMSALPRWLGLFK